MISKWYELKNEALKMRHNGNSIREIERILRIPRSTLSGWFKNIKLTKGQKGKLDKNLHNALNQARKKAVVWHNKQKEIRIIKAQSEAINTLKNIDKNDDYILELALAMLYLGEGAKSNVTSMGNSNPLILKFFIKSIKTLFNVDKSDIKCDLHLRSDQKIKENIIYWSNELDIPKSQFSAIKDKRIAKSKTYTYYKGVCVVRCGRVAIQRRMVHLAEEFSKIVIAR